MSISIFGDISEGVKTALQTKSWAELKLIVQNSANINCVLIKTQWGECDADYLKVCGRSATI